NLVLDQGYDFLDDLPSPQDDESHGTAVAGIIGATGNNREGVTGIAWHVKLLPIKALNSQGRGPDSAMVKAILYAADSGARIINISSTGTRYSAAHCTQASPAPRSRRRTSPARPLSCGRCGPTWPPPTSSPPCARARTRLRARTRATARAFSTSLTRLLPCAWACRRAYPMQSR